MRRISPPHVAVDNLAKRLYIVASEPISRYNQKFAQQRHIPLIVHGHKMEAEVGAFIYMVDIKSDDFKPDGFKPMV